MENFDFTILATGLDPQAEDFEGRFFDSGCDDATVSFQKGYILVDFSREAASMEEAVSSAVEHVRLAGATVERVEPDPLVSLSDMAGRANLSRSAMTNYFKGDRYEGFPAPRARVTTDSPLWDWAEASAWLYRRQRISRSIAVAAMVVSRANEVITSGDHDFRGALHQRVVQGMKALA